MLLYILREMAERGEQTMGMMQDNGKLTQDELEKLLIELLDSQDVQDKIRRIAADPAIYQEIQENSGLAELRRLQQRELELMEDCKRFKEDAAVQEDSARRAEIKAKEWREQAQQWEERTLRAESQLEQWKAQAEKTRLEFSDISRAIALYEKLSQASRHSLENIFRSTKPELFIASGVQIDNLKQLWEFAKSEIMEGRTEETDLLSELIGYFMNLYNQINGRKIYDRIEAKAGTVFDVDWHIRTSGSRPAGVIDRVYLDGYVNANNGSIFGKSVVQVG